MGSNNVDHEVQHNRLDIVIVPKKEETGLLIDIADPQDNNVLERHQEKARKYSALEDDMKHTIED